MNPLWLTCILLFLTYAFGEETPYFLLDEYIQEINVKQSLWVAGRNFDVNTPLSKIHRLTGVIPSKTNKNRPRKVSPKRKFSEIPETFDAREHWPNCPSIAEIKDQGTCSSDWAVAATSMIQDRICIKSNGTKQVYISAQDLITCCGYSCGRGCDGGDDYEALEYWKKHGIVTGGGFGTNDGCKAYTFKPCNHTEKGDNCNDMPEERTPECKRECDDGVAESYNDTLSFGKKAYYLDYEDVEAIQNDILKNGPVISSFTVYRDFFHYKSGIYVKTSKHLMELLHDVKIIGWGSENGVDYWLCANSWNADWGDKGLFKIIRGVDHCGIEMAAVGGIPKM